MQKVSGQIIYTMVSMARLTAATFLQMIGVDCTHYGTVYPGMTENKVKTGLYRVFAFIQAKVA
ncbi:hypothetical protein [Aliamphritea spongicola]|nr:hypothetical protein [Aliamphritea spongicola]